MGGGGASYFDDVDVVSFAIAEGEMVEDVVDGVQDPVDMSEGFHGTEADLDDTRARKRGDG